MKGYSSIRLQGREFKPHGKSNRDVFESILAEARTICNERDFLYSRHLLEIDANRVENNNNEWTIDCASFRRIVTSNMLEIGEPETFDYDFHMMRKSLLEELDNLDDIDIGMVFSAIASNCGLRVFVRAIFSANQTIGLIYDQPSNPKEIPKLCLYSFDHLEINVAILKLFLGYGDQFGFDDLFKALESQGR